MSVTKGKRNLEYSRVALITMPFAPANLPSIQLGILKTLLETQNVRAEDHYFNIDFFSLMKEAGVHRIYNSTLPGLLSEWFFSPVPLDHTKKIENMQAIERLTEFANSTGLNLKDLLKIKNELAPAFIDQVIEKINWDKYRVAAFTLTYAQVNSSFALAHRIKDENPGIKFIFGGAFSRIHPDSIVEYMKNYPFIDYFILGEAELTFANLVKLIVEGDEEDDKLEDLPGLYYRKNGKIKRSGKLALLTDMEKYPKPDYSTYFKRLKEADLNLRVHLNRSIPIEMSRGCPWGEKKPCTFCAFYPAGKFRPRPADSLINEMKEQVKENRTRSFYVVDAAVNSTMIEQVFTRFDEVAGKIFIPFIEVRTSLKKSHVQILARAGVTMAQPGIECLETGLLKRINKGVSVFNNLLFMKWCRELGINLSYNIILGIPDATVDELKKQLKTMKKIVHLAPPFPMPLSIVRFSRYWRCPDKFKLRNLKPDEFYKYVYPAEIDLDNVAYGYTADLPPEAYQAAPVYRRTVLHIQRWRKLWADPFSPPYLTLKEKDGSILISDGRNSKADPKNYTFSDVKASVYNLCMDSPKNVDALMKSLKSEFPGIDEKQVEDALEEFMDKDLMVEELGLFLSLAVPETVD